MERLQKYIASSGYTSRRKAEDLIREGRVSVNGQVVTELGTKVKSGDVVLIDGEAIVGENKVYYLFQWHFQNNNHFCQTNHLEIKLLVKIPN